MRYIYFISLFFLLCGCKKSDVQTSIPIHNTSGTFTFTMQGYGSIDGYTKVSAFSNGILYLGGNSNSDNSVSPQYIFNISTPILSIQIGSYSDSINFESMYAPSSYYYYNTNKVTLNIGSYNSTTKFIKCTFSGTIKDELNKIYTITNGSIYGTIQ